MSELLPSGETVPVNALSAPSTWPRVLTSADAPRQGGAGDLGDLKEILGIVRRRRWLVLSFASLGAGIAAYFAYSAKPVFLASASVRIADARNALSGGIADAPRDNIGSSYSVDPVLSQIQVLKSREVAAEAVRRQPLGLIVYPEGFPASDVDQVKVDSLQLRSTAITVDFDADSYTLHESGHDLTARYGQPLSVAGVTLAIVRRPARRSAIIGVLSKYNAIGMLLDGVDARPRKSTDVVDVTYRANDPFVAQQVVNSIVARRCRCTARTRAWRPNRPG